MTSISTSRHTLSEDPALRATVMSLVESVAKENGIAPVSEQFELGLSDPRLGHSHILAYAEGEVCGLLAVDPSPEVPVAELVVRPGGRREASALLDATDGPIDLWSHGVAETGQLPGARKVRELLVMRVAERLEKAEVPSSFTVMNLVQSREKLGTFADEEFLRVNNEAFSWHPEQGNWDHSRWDRAQEADWFDPAGVLLLWSGVDVDKSAHLSGFHWTKCATSHSVNGKQNLGEVYVVGLADSARGQGLGKAITLLGINFLQENGCDQVELYVEADNEAAVNVYQKLGFTVRESHILYRFHN